MIKLYQKSFRKFLAHEQIIEGVNALAARLNADYDDGVVFVGVLNGAFMFMSELMQRINLLCEVSFVKLASYVGTASSGRIDELIGLSCDVHGRRVVVVEDIVETGRSTGFLMSELLAAGACDVEVAALFLKPAIYQGERPVKYAAFPIDSEFIVGFGLDYNGLGRNFPDVYKEV